MRSTMDAPSDEDTVEESTASTDDPAQPDEDDETDHLNDLPDGAGCAEVWEHLSESRSDD